MASLSDFIPSSVMNEFINEKFRKSLVAVNCVSTDYSSLLSKAGDSVKIPTVLTSGASNYTRNQACEFVLCE